MQEMSQQLLLLSGVSRSEARRLQLGGTRDWPDANCKGWPDRLSVVFQNLIGNALKYRKVDVPPRVEICSWTRVRSGKYP